MIEYNIVNAVPLAKNILAPLGITAAASAIKYMVLEQQL